MDNTMILLNEWIDGGFSGFSVWQILLYFVIMTQITIATVTIYLHRSCAHRAVDLHPALVHFFRFWVFLTTSMVPSHWVAVHRKHHVMCETEEDPHSPQILGIKKVLLEGVELYREAITPENVERYANDMPNDWFERNIYRPRSLNGCSFLLVINLLMFGPIGLTVWACQLLWIPVWAAGVINGLGHYLGYRNHECQGAAVNIVPWAFWIGGEELHNNHHTYPNSAKFSVKWWEFDIGWMYISILSFIGLAKVRSKGPVVHRDHTKISVDLDTVRGIVNDRFQVLTQFKNKVFKQVATDECLKLDNPKIKAMMKKAPKLLAREENQKTEQDREQIEKIFFTSERMKAVYLLHEDLKALWSGHMNKEELLDAFVDWLERAERSGIESLRNFSDYLKAYTLPRQVPSTDIG